MVARKNEVVMNGVIFDMDDPQDRATVEFINECFHNPALLDELDFEITMEEAI